MEEPAKGAGRFLPAAEARSATGGAEIDGGHLDMCIFPQYTVTVPGDRDSITELREFEWDDGNSAKSWQKHSVRPTECEELFGERPLLTLPASQDLAHSTQEPRHLALGQTRAGRQLFVVFTIRGQRLRVISARDMSRRERSAYEKARAEEEREDPSSDPTLR